MASKTEQLWTSKRAVGEKFTIGAPRGVALGISGTQLLTLENLVVDVEVHLSVAFVSLKARLRYSTEVQEPAFVFELPTTPSTTVTSVILDLPNNRSYETLVVEASPTLENFGSREGEGLRTVKNRYNQTSGRQISEFDPDLFAIPFVGLQHNETVSVEVSYIEKLAFSEGNFCFQFPLSVPEEALRKPLNEIASVTVTLNSTSQACDWSCCSHPVKEVNCVNERAEESSALYQTKVELNRDECWDSIPFNLSYSSWEDRITCRAIVEHGDAKEKHSTVALFLTPPKTVVDHMQYHSRQIVFIIDRSGSMGFENVMDDAKEALVSALHSLKPGDSFAICAFDHRQYWFSAADAADLNPPDSRPESLDAEVVKPTLSSGIKADSFAIPEAPQVPVMEHRTGKKVNRFFIPFNETNIAHALEWVSAIHPGGTTDILTPIQQAVTGMNLFPTQGEGINNEATQLFMENGAVPMLFLVTDGAVENEREICTFLRSVSHVVRTFGFGIGSACNSYFLRKCAAVGRGYSDVALHRESVRSQMSALIESSSLPCLTNVTAEFIDKAIESDAKWYPEKFPDLYAGAPIIASSSFDPDVHAFHVDSKGSAGEILVKGQQVLDGKKVAAWQTTAQIHTADDVPLSKVFAQQRLENLITHTWFVDPDSQEGVLARNECIELAVSESLPSAFTEMVLRETATSHVRARSHKNLTPSEVREELRRSKGSMMVIGAAVVGAAAFGSIAATMAVGGVTAGAVAEGVAQDGLQEVACGDGCEGCDCECADGDCFSCLELLEICEGC